MKAEFLNKEIYILKKENEFLFYAPLKGVISLINEDVILAINAAETPEQLKERFPDLYNSLENLEFFETKLALPQSNINKKPTSVTIFPTSDCNLRCIYCYGNAGKEKKYMDIDIAKASVDYIVSNAKELGVREILVGFHGGGEPFYSKIFSAIVSVVEHAKYKAKKENLSLKLSAASNCVMPAERAKWIAENFDIINVSLDGSEDIQNYQRPTEENVGSYDSVMRTLKIFEENNLKYGFRSTVTQKSVNRLEEIVLFCAEKTTSKKIQFEPVSIVGRSLTTNTLPVSDEDFIKNFIKAKELGEQLGIKIVFSGCRIDAKLVAYCGAAGRNFCITPEGYVSSCYEVSLLSDPRSKDFFYGKYDKKKKTFVFFEDIREKLSERVIYNLDNCLDCFAKWNCAGDCLAKVAFQKGNMFNTEGHNRCDLIKSLTKKKLFEIAHEKIDDKI